MNQKLESTTFKDICRESAYKLRLLERALESGDVPRSEKGIYYLEITEERKTKTLGLLAA